MNSGVSDDELKTSINRVATYLDGVAPNISTVSIFSQPEIDRADFFSQLMPTSLDWIGFDCYLTFGTSCSAQNIQRLFNLTASGKSPAQKIVLVPRAFWSSSPSEPGDEIIVAQLSLYKNLASSSVDVVAIYPFLFQSDASSNKLGADVLPKTRAELLNWYNALGGY